MSADVSSTAANLSDAPLEGGITKRAGLRKITPHMLRHGCGYALINKGYDVRVVQDYLGHKDIRNTAIYTRLDDKQFKGLWE